MHFKLVTANADSNLFYFDDVFALMKFLQAAGEQNAAFSSRGNVSRETLIAADAIYRHLFTEKYGEWKGKVYSTFELIHYIGWKEHPDQLKPLKPGSKGVDITTLAEEIDDYVPAANEDNFKVTITSKTVDIKKLKETMWAELNKKNSKNPVLNTEKNSFLSIVGALPSSMSSNEVENLSIHSCFITILHLANEHNLKLEQTAPCDFKIYEKPS